MTQRSDHRVAIGTRKANKVVPQFRASDVLLFVYLAAVIRQYFWILPSNFVAWAFTVLLAAVICGILAGLRGEGVEEKPSRAFWLIVGVPLLFMYAIRVVFPDFTYDILNYHLINGERALRGRPWIPGDFFPGILTANPTADMIFGIARRLFGYRLGTIVNVGAMLWSAVIIERILRPHLSRDRVRSFAVLLAVSTDLTLFLLPRYMIDLLALPLLLEATELVLAQRESGSVRTRYFRICILLGIAIGLKLTNIAFAIPILLLGLYREGRQLFKWNVLAAGVLLLVPLLPFAIFLYGRTANPFFPFYNKVFRSPYLEARNIKDPVHGPHRIRELVAWPLLGSFHPTRVGAVIVPGSEGMYSGRLLLIVLASIAAVLWPRIGRNTRQLALVVLLASWIWSFVGGEVRYGLYLEIAGAVVLLCLAAEWTREQDMHDQEKGRYQTLAWICGGLLVVQTAAACWIAIVSVEPSSYMNGRPQPTIFQDPHDALAQARYLLSDYSALPLLTDGQRAQLDDVDVWIASDNATSGLEFTYRPQAPVVSIHPFVGMANYYESAATRSALQKVLSDLSGKRLFTLVWQNHLEEAKTNLAAQGLKGISETSILLPFYSSVTRLPLILIRVESKGPNE